MKTMILTFLMLFISQVKPNYSQEDYDYLENMAAIKNAGVIYEAKYILKNNYLVREDSTIYFFNTKNMITRIVEGKSYSIPIREFFYDSQDRISRIENNTNGIKYKNLYEYQSGRLTFIKTRDVKNKLINSVKFHYNSRGELTKKTATEKKYAVLNQYYNGNKIKAEITNNSKSKTDIEYLYDDNNNLIMEKIFDTMKSSKNKKKYLKLKIEYKYYDENKLLEKKIHLTDKISEKIIYLYNEDKSLKEWQRLDAQGKIIFVTKYHY